MCLSVCAELYEIFLSRAKEKWRSYSETSSVNDSESGTTQHQCEFCYTQFLGMNVQLRLSAQDLPRNKL